MKIHLIATQITFLIPEIPYHLCVKKNVKNLLHLNNSIINSPRKNEEIIIMLVKAQKMMLLVLKLMAKMILLLQGKGYLMIFVVKKIIVTYIAVVVVVVILRIIPLKIVFYSGRSICLSRRLLLSNKNYGQEITYDEFGYYLSMKLICIKFKYIIVNSDLDDLIKYWNYTNIDNKRRENNIFLSTFVSVNTII